MTFLRVLLVLMAFLDIHIAHAQNDPKYYHMEGDKVQKMESSLVAPRIDCAAACSIRCRLSSRHNLCMRACGTCCARCNCVPPGTAGNKELCSCYNNMTTHGGRKKCP